MCCNQLCWLLLPQYIIYKDPATFEAIFLKLAICCAQFFCLSMFAMLIFYIAMLHRRMKTFNVENVKLLDGMHEGLLIVHKSTTSMQLTREIMFCNKSAEKLLTNLFSFWNLNASRNNHAGQQE